MTASRNIIIVMDVIYPFTSVSSFGHVCCSSASNVFFIGLVVTVTRPVKILFRQFSTLEQLSSDITEPVSHSLTLNISYNNQLYHVKCSLFWPARMSVNSANSSSRRNTTIEGKNNYSDFGWRIGTNLDVETWMLRLERQQDWSSLVWICSQLANDSRQERHTRWFQCHRPSNCRP